MNTADNAPPTSTTSNPAPQYFVGSQIAKICEVDLKTIHNWVGHNHIPQDAWFRTPGRHLRFRIGPTLTWLAQQGYTVPEELRAQLGAVPSPAAPFIAQAFLEAERISDLDHRAKVIFDLLKRAIDVDPLLATEIDHLRKGDRA